MKVATELPMQEGVVVLLSVFTIVTKSTTVLDESSRLHSRMLVIGAVVLSIGGVGDGASPGSACLCAVLECLRACVQSAPSTAQ